jgi:hypothetical protein
MNYKLNQMVVYNIVEFLFQKYESKTAPQNGEVVLAGQTH